MEKEINVILTRHGRYTRSEDKKFGGHLTEVGKREIEEKTKQRMQNIVGEDMLDTNFLVVGSPTHWLSKKQYGQRALETEYITKQTIKSMLISQGVRPEDMDKYIYSKKQVYTRNIENALPVEQLAKLLSEPNVYDEAPEYIRKLKLKHNGTNSSFWEELSSSEEAKQYSDKAETPSVLNERIKLMLNYVFNWAQNYAADNDKNVCVILITHGETMTPFINNQKLKGLVRSRL
ncbi:MAG: hypothetical protein HFJ17_00785 [Clostridia bacterium]|nr:hypothetical protein [Clostridia bacterium]